MPIAAFLFSQPSAAAFHSVAFFLLLNLQSFQASFLSFPLHSFQRDFEVFDSQPER